MFYLNVPTIKGVKKEIVYNVYDFPYKKFYRNKMCKKRYGETYYYNIPCAFDIESTTIEPPKVDDKYIFQPYAFMYHWQFCLIDTVVFGRTWEEFIYFLDTLRHELKLTDKKRLVVYVHNLAYEFQFIKDFLRIDEMFSKDKRKPMKLFSDGIEFRCSYFLSNMNLIKFCENSEGVEHFKLVDEYDYSKKRLPNTPLTEKEQGYCYNDVRGLAECIASKLKVDTITTIPLTSTGYVRREYRSSMRTNKNRTQFKKTKLSAEEYIMLRKAFRGGNTHANRFKANQVLKEVTSFDISSSYPTCIAIDDYPIGKFSEVTFDNQDKLNYFCDNFCVVLEIEFFNIKVKKGVVIPYIDIAHCLKKEQVINDNGRVLKANYINLTLTNIDLDIIRSTYNFDGFEIKKAIYAEKGKLPNELRKKMMDFFTNKTQLKGVEGKEYEYNKSKNMLNATYGMTVTDIAHSEVYYDSDSMEWEELEPDLENAIENYYKSRNSFLSYQWGVFVTANARKRLQHMLDIVGEDVVYIDTDSIKFVGVHHIKEFEEYNRELVVQAENNDIPAFVDRTSIKDGKTITERFHLGTWDNDGNYIKFKTLGAKKYCFNKLDKKGNEYFEITVSGMSKKKGSQRVGSIDNFLIGKTYTDIGRTTSWYNDEYPHKITIDDYTFTTASSIGILDTSYTLGVTNEYWELINSNKNDEII